MEMAIQMTSDQGYCGSLQSARELEAYALNKAATFLEDVQGHWYEDGSRIYLAEVLRYNHRLWNLFEVDAAESCGRLPDEIRQNILSLSNFIGRRTQDLMESPAPEKLNILIKINRTLAEGLQAN